MKQNIQDNEDTTPDQQRLIFTGKEPENGRTPSGNDIERGT